MAICQASGWVARYWSEELGRETTEELVCWVEDAGEAYGMVAVDGLRCAESYHPVGKYDFAGYERKEPPVYLPGGGYRIRFDAPDIPEVPVIAWMWAPDEEFGISRAIVQMTVDDNVLSSWSASELRDGEFSGKVLPPEKEETNGHA